jgi:hypothetical protein
LNQYLAQHPSATTTTNIMPGTATPSLSVPYKLSTAALNSGADPRSLIMQGAQSTANPLEGKRVRDKQSGLTGTITDGAFVPDDSTNENGDAASM